MTDKLKNRDETELSNQHSPYGGLYGEFLNEGMYVPEWKESGSENLIQGNNNSFIVLGRDRDESKAGGAGGYGGTGCGSIDLVCGLGGYQYKKHIKKWKKKNSAGEAGGGVAYAIEEVRRVDPSFFKDSARVYITEKGNIDEYFGLAVGSESKQMAKYKSGVGIKADHVRLIGREHVKIVAGKSRLEGGGTYGERNSKGGKIKPGESRIDFIAGNYTDPKKKGILSVFGKFLPLHKKKTKTLQPVVKGQSLIKYLKKVQKNQTDLQSMINANSNAIMELTTYFAAHFHEFGGVLGSPTGPPLALGSLATTRTGVHFAKNKAKSLKFTFELLSQNLNYLNPLMGDYINSNHVNTT